MSKDQWRYANISKCMNNEMKINSSLHLFCLLNHHLYKFLFETPDKINSLEEMLGKRDKVRKPEGILTQLINSQSKTRSLGRTATSLFYID